MEKIIANLPEYVELLAQFMGALAVFATVLVRLIPSKSDSVDSISAKIFKFIGYLPTIGLNPQTKKLKEAYEELRPKEPSK